MGCQNSCWVLAAVHKGKELLNNSTWYIHNILANCPGQSRKLTSCPTVLEAFKIVPEIIHMASALILYY